MLIAAVVLNCLVAVLLCVNAAKYGQGPVPLTYHSKMMAAEGTTLSPFSLQILEALYRALAGAMLAMAVLIMSLALGPVAADQFWAQLAILLAGAVFTLGGYTVPRRVEEMTGVQTPWRLSLVLGGGLALAFVLAVLG